MAGSKKQLRSEIADRSLLEVGLKAFVIERGQVPVNELNVKKFEISPKRAY